TAVPPRSTRRTPPPSGRSHRDGPYWQPQTTGPQLSRWGAPVWHRLDEAASDQLSSTRKAAAENLDRFRGIGKETEPAQILCRYFLGLELEGEGLRLWVGSV